MQNLAEVSRKFSGPFVNAKSFYTGNQLINAVHSLLRFSVFMCEKHTRYSTVGINATSA